MVAHVKSPRQELKELVDSEELRNLLDEETELTDEAKELLIRLIHRYTHSTYPNY